jgi:hypothetical protein
MLHARQDLAFGCSIALQFIGYDPTLSQKLFESRKLSEKRKYSHTAWLIISGGKRNPL